MATYVTKILDTHIYGGALSFKNSSTQLLLYCCALLFRKNHYNIEQRVLNLEMEYMNLVPFN